MDNLFSHATPPVEKTAQEEEELQAVCVHIELPLAETWVAFTEYTHLWWPTELKRTPESYIEFGEQLLIEEDEEGEQFIQAETQYFIPEDVIAIYPRASEFNDVFQDGMSFVFDEETTSSSLVEISSGIVKPKDLEDSEIGISTPQLVIAQQVLGGFARFMKAELTVENIPSTS